MKEGTSDIQFTSRSLKAVRLLELLMDNGEAFLTAESMQQF